MNVFPCQHHALVQAAATPTPLSDITAAVNGWAAHTFDPTDPTHSLATTFFHITEAAKVAEASHAPFDKGMVMLNLMATMKATPLHCDPDKHLRDATIEWEEGTNVVTAKSQHKYGTYNYGDVTDADWILFIAHFTAADAHRLRDLQQGTITAGVAAPSYGATQSIAPPGYAHAQTTLLAPYDQAEGDFAIHDVAGPSDAEIASDNALAARNDAEADRNEARTRREASERRLAASTQPTTSAAATWTPGSVPTGSKRIASLAARGGHNGQGKGDRSVRCPYDDRKCCHCRKFPAYGHVYDTWEHTEASCSRNPNRDAALYRKSAADRVGVRGGDKRG